MGPKLVIVAVAVPCLFVCVCLQSMHRPSVYRAVTLSAATKNMPWCKNKTKRLAKQQQSA